MLTLQSRFASVTILCTLVICLFSATPVKAVSLSPFWEITGSDVLGRTWNGSTLFFSKDSPLGTNHSLGGFFEWTSNDGRSGEEHFVGTLFPNNHLIIDGTAITGPASGIILSHYEADLTPSGTQLINGVWTMRAAGVWSATILPEPETYAMLLTGLGLIGFIARRQNGPQRARSSEFPIPFKTVRMNS